MNSGCARKALRGASKAFCIGWVCVGAASLAAQPTPPAATAPEAAASAPAYVDRVIEGLPPQDSEAAAPVHDPRGRPRWWRAEARLGRETASIGEPLSTLGLAFQGGYDTHNHGAWSIDAQTRRVKRRDALQPPLDDAIDTVLTLRQRGFPLGGGWWMNNDLGAIGLSAAPLARAPARIVLPLVRVQGASAEFVQPGEGWATMLSTGRPAVIDSFFTSELSLQPGRITQAAVQWRLGDPRRPAAATTQVAAQVARGNDLQWTPQGALVQARSLWLGARHQAAWGAGQLQWLTSSTDDAQARSAQGLWFDADWRSGTITHHAGGYTLGADLNWAGVPMAGDARGAYWRAQWQDWRTSVDGGLDVLRSGLAARTGVYGTFNARRRVQRNLSWGLSTALRRLDSLAYNLAADLQWSHRLGQTVGRVELDGDRGQTDVPPQSGQRFVLQHDWALSNGWTWSTGATLGQVRGRGGAPDSSVLALATSLDASLTPTLTLRGAGNAERFAGQLRSGLQAALEWQLAPAWQLETRLNIDRGRLQRFRSLDPLAPPLLPEGTALNARSAFIVLRYSGSAGTGGAPLGGRGGDGGGAIEGLVFLDNNRNGRQDAGERGAAGVTVSLDGRYSTVTDSQGRFEFAWVAAGLRAVTVLNETLPLPWSAPDEGRSVVEVTLRGRHSVVVGVVSQ